MSRSASSSDGICKPRNFSRWGRVLLAGSLVLAWNGGFQAFEARARADSPAAGAAQLTRDQRIDMLRRLLLTLKEIDAAAMRRMDDPRAIADQEKHDPAALCAWVGRNTQWVPYHGALRGSAGVMLDHLGNSLDRAILLADLLKASGFDTRLAHAHLPDAMAGDLLAKMQPVPRDWKYPTFPATDADNAAIDGYMKKLGVDADRVKQKQAGCELKIEQATESIVQRASEQSPAVAELALGATSAKDPPAPDTASRRAALADHWWVQYRAAGGQDSWASLDPTCGDATGKPPVDPVATVDRDKEGRFAISPADAHEVEIRVVVEQWQDGKLHDNVPLKYVVRPMNFIGEQITLAHVGINWPSNFDFATGPDAAGKLRQLAAAPREWVPVLLLGGRTIIQGGINPDGSIDPKPKLNPLVNTGSSTADAGKGVLGAFGGGPPPAPEPPKPTGALTAEWIEYEIRTPGQQPEIRRRELFDLIGPTRRAAGVPAAPAITDSQRVQQGLVMLGQTDVALLPCNVPPAAVEHLAARACLNNAQLMLDVAQNPPTTLTALGDFAGRIALMPTELYSLASMRLGASPVGSSVYLDQVNILTKHKWLIDAPAQGPGDKPAGPFRGMQAYDIVENRVAVHPRQGRNPAAVRLQQGVADTVAESVLISDGTHFNNASESFAASGAHGRGWIALTQKDSAKLRAIDLPADVRTRMEGELALGRTILLAEKPASPIDVAWWSIDPKTGQTLGLSSNGWGGSMVDEALLYVQIVMKVAAMIYCIANSLANPDSQKAVAGTSLCILGAMAGGAALAGGRAGAVLSTVADFFSAVGSKRTM